MKNKNKNKIKTSHSEIPDLMFQNVKIPESLAPTPINPGIDEANQINIPRNPASSLHALDWDVPDERFVTDPNIPATPNPHTNPHTDKKKQ